MEAYEEKLTQWVFDEQRIVTSRWLARSLTIPLSLAKKLLFWCKHRATTQHIALKATYLLCGELLPREEEAAASQKSAVSLLSSTGSATREEVTRAAIKIVPEEQLAAARALFATITAESIYALHPAELRDVLPLAQLQDETESMVYALPPVITLNGQLYPVKTATAQAEPKPAVTKPVETKTAPPPPKTAAKPTSAPPKDAPKEVSKKQKVNKRQIDSDEEEEAKPEEEMSVDAMPALAQDIFGDVQHAPIKKMAAQPEKTTTTKKKQEAAPRTKKKLKVDVEEDELETAKEAKTYEDDEGCLVTEYVPVTRTKTERVKVKRKIGASPPSPKKMETKEPSKEAQSETPKEAPREEPVKEAPPEAAPPRPAPAAPKANTNKKAPAAGAVRKQGTLFNFFGKK